jgi:hypothetical protein
VVSISACHAEDPGSIPGRGTLSLRTRPGGCDCFEGGADIQLPDCVVFLDKWGLAPQMRTALGLGQVAPGECRGSSATRRRLRHTRREREREREREKEKGKPEHKEKGVHNVQAVGWVRSAFAVPRWGFCTSWVHSSVVRAADCRSAGPWFKSGCALYRSHRLGGRRAKGEKAAWRRYRHTSLERLYLLGAEIADPLRDSSPQPSD